MTKKVSISTFGLQAKFGDFKALEIAKEAGTDIQVLYLNDNDGVTDQHKIPGMGNIVWDDVMRALQEVGYSGVYNMELRLDYLGDERMPEEAATAVRVMKNMLK